MESVIPVGQEINLIFGQLGRLAVILAFSLAALATFAYYKAEKSQGNWLRLARAAFIGHAISVLSIMVVLFIMIFGHHFEYHYVWHHSSKDLPFKYILSCFWEGQEGSFLLWAFWHAVIGLFLIWRARKWEAPVMTVVAGLQFFIVSFLLGIYLGDVKIGTSPFVLLKDALTHDPVFLFDDYMRFVQDGTGLNALLQNYWMVIHPPVLFLGFASATIPFAFAVGALWRRKYSEWIRPALPYTLFSAMALGTGILMGGRWAYESLSFGGFWAWDPVENASLVPWLILIGGLHNMVAYRHSGRALRSSFMMIFLSFFFVIFSTYLARSGLLGETSVHSFVDAGLNSHLLVFLISCGPLSWLLLARNWRNIPSIQQEEATSSREFWMFMGALIFLFASLQIIVVTSVPAINAFFKSFNGVTGLSLPADWPVPVDPVSYYNNIQIWVAILVGLLIGLSHFLSYRKTNGERLYKRLAGTLAISIVLTALFTVTSGLSPLTEIDGIGFALPSKYLFLLFAGCFAMVGNLHYFLTVIKGRVNISGGSIAHAGFGIMLIGILISNAKQEVISQNVIGINYGEQFDDEFKRDNVLLYKNMPQKMGDFQVTYLGDTAFGDYTYFNVGYQRLDKNGDPKGKPFVLQPHLIKDKKSQQLSANPATRHYPFQDLFTHISSMPSADAQQSGPVEREHKLRMNDTLYFSIGMMVLEDLLKFPPEGDTLKLGLRLRVQYRDVTTHIEPLFTLAGNRVISPPVVVEDAGFALAFVNIDPTSNEFEIKMIEEASQDDWIIMKAIIFPQINLVWGGTIILVIGFILSILRRWRERTPRSKTSQANA